MVVSLVLITDLITETATEWLRGGVHVPGGYALQGDGSCLGQKEMGPLKISSFRKACNLNIMNYLLEFSI